MKTILGVVLAGVSVLSLLLGVGYPQQVQAQENTNSAELNGKAPKLESTITGTKEPNMKTFNQTEFISAKNTFSLTAAPYQIGNINVTGTYSATDLSSITKVVLLVDGVIVKNGAFNHTTGTFQIYATGLITDASQKVEVALFNRNTELKREAVSVTEPPIHDYVITPAPYQIGNISVTGTYSGTNLNAITKVVLLVDGVIVKNGAFNHTTKTFQISADGNITDIHRKVEVALFEGNKELKRSSVSIVSNYNLAVSPYQLGAESVIGTYSGTNLHNITRVALAIDGLLVKEGSLDTSTNTFQIPVTSLITDLTQKAEVVIFNGNTELKRTSVQVIGNYNLIASPYRVGNTFVTGTYSGTGLDLITKVVLAVDGVIVKNGTFNTSTNTFQIYASGFVTSSTQKVEVILFKGNMELGRTEVSVSSHGDYGIEAAPFKLGGTYVTGTYSGTDLDAITKIALLVDGVIVQNGTFNHTAKTFRIYASNRITSSSQTVEVAIFSGSNELKRTSVIVDAN
ncbi:immunoglobulin-like domain-containing protein [Listeria booriae]|uniref:immunoglobulin-like domain-containing protein n=1 Tax=Listeria booriae TaxID=1552123 RepID=UPI00162356CD|nr:immunoglobulin-like domain-containing protein [Listeria booriae]MBC2208102.1 hypothetical protein [Listeria booriae]